jgi:hypothetical protein
VPPGTVISIRRSTRYQLLLSLHQPTSSASRTHCRADQRFSRLLATVDRQSNVLSCRGVRGAVSLKVGAVRVWPTTPWKADRRVIHEVDRVHERVLDDQPVVAWQEVTREQSDVLVEVGEPASEVRLLLQPRGERGVPDALAEWSPSPGGAGSIISSPIARCWPRNT